MPTDLPPDYKPQPTNDPNNPADPKVPGSKPAFPPEQGEDARDNPMPKPAPDADAVDPLVPAPAGMPTF